MVAAVAGVVLVAAGGAEFWAGLASGGSWVALGSGAFTLVTGAVATLWADPVLMPIAVAIGWRLVLVGAGLLVDLWYPAGLLGARTGARGSRGAARSCLLPEPVRYRVGEPRRTRRPDPRP